MVHRLAVHFDKIHNETRGHSDDHIVVEVKPILKREYMKNVQVEVTYEVEEQ